MGTYCTLKSATPQQLDILRAHAEFVAYFYDPENASVPRPGFVSRLLGRTTGIPPALADQSQCMEVSIDKAWDGLNYLFTRVAPDARAAEFLLEGGIELSRDAHMLLPEDVEEFRDFVHSTPEAELRKAYDPEDMAQEHVYPDIIWEREGEEALDWLFEFHQRLWAFLRDAVEEGHGCVIWIAS